jgi:hypothetical protein
MQSALKGAYALILSSISIVGVTAGAVSGNESLFGLAGAVGGIGGLLSVLIYVTSRKDAGEARKAYEALVVLMVERMDNMIAAQGRIMEEQGNCLKGVRDAVLEIEKQLELMATLTSVLEGRDARFRTIRSRGVGAGGPAPGGPEGADEG